MQDNRGKKHFFRFFLKYFSQFSSVKTISFSRFFFQLKNLLPKENETFQLTIKSSLTFIANFSNNLVALLQGAISRQKLQHATVFIVSCGRTCPFIEPGDCNLVKFFLAEAETGETRRRGNLEF